MKRRNLITSLFILIAMLLAACAPATTAGPTTLASPNIILATTTSTQDSGLLDVLVPIFQDQTDYTVQTIAVGSGEAMKMGEKATRMCCWSCAALGR